MRNVLRLGKQDLLFLLLLAGLCAYHLSLLGTGTWSWPDEYLYRDSLLSVPPLVHGDVREFCRSIMGFGARPVEALIRLPGAIIQQGLHHWYGVGLDNPEALLIPTTFNVLVLALISILVYKLSLYFLDGRRLPATVTTAVYCFMGSSTIHLRHVFPYDNSLFFMLLSLCYALGLDTATPPRPVAERRYFICGLIAGLGMATYPAYFPFPPAVLGIILWQHGYRPTEWLAKPARRAGLRFAAGGLCVLAACEVIARIGGVSYLGCSYRLSKTITQGSFEEGYTFLFKYLVEVEQLIGVVLLALAAAYLLGPFWISLSRNAPPGRWALSQTVLLMGLAYLTRASQSTLLHEMNLCGRYIAWFLPFVVWAAMAFVTWLPWPRTQNVCYAVVLACSIFTLITFDREYRNLAYPMNALHTTRVRLADVVDANKVHETPDIPNGYVYNLSGKGIVHTIDAVTVPHDDRYLLVNFSFFALTGEPPSPFVGPPGATKVYEGVHYLCSRAGRFEGYSIEKRHEFATRQYHVAVYRLPDRQASP